VITDSAEAERVAPEWSDLLERCGQNELTVTPGWMLTWLRVYGGLQGRQLRLALFRDADRLVGLAPLVRRLHWYRGLVPFRRLEFLASGEHEGHGICSNHLGVIALPAMEEVVARRLVVAVQAGEFGAFDEVVLPMMDGDRPMTAALEAAFREGGLDTTVVETARAPYILLPATWEKYLGSLSGAHRRHLTRSLRAFEEWAGGEVSLERATDAAGLEKGRRILIDLHHGRWGRVGQPGVFRSLLFLHFHEQMMPWLLERGALELTWLRVRGEPVAVLYAMTWGGKVSAYQIGRRLEVPGKVGPGTMILAQAIRVAIAAGCREFDLLADEAPYKLQLGSGIRSLVELRAGRGGLREQARRVLERCRDVVRSVRRRMRR
jgi:CelD/BcsL family acetyltransferase involved in cellulose biosynthesis